MGLTYARWPARFTAGTAITLRRARNVVASAPTRGAACRARAPGLRRAARSDRLEPSTAPCELLEPTRLIADACGVRLHTRSYVRRRHWLQQSRSSHAVDHRNREPTELPPLRTARRVRRTHSGKPARFISRAMTARRHPDHRRCAAVCCATPPHAGRLEEHQPGLAARLGSRMLVRRDPRDPGLSSSGSAYPRLAHAHAARTPPDREPPRHSPAWAVLPRTDAPGDGASAARCASPTRRAVGPAIEHHPGFPPRPPSASQRIVHTKV